MMRRIWIVGCTNFLNRFLVRGKDTYRVKLSDNRCVFCENSIPQNWGDTNCPSCQSRARVRSLAPLLRDAILPRLAKSAARSKPVMLFSAAGAERKLLVPHFPDYTSVSLFGRYGKNHQEGVDARSLAGFADDAYACQYSCGLYDYFAEHEPALAEAYRVIAPGGVFLTHIAHIRLRETKAAPRVRSVIKPKPGFYDYIPADRQMVNVRVGTRWFLDSMRKVGFAAERWRVDDPTGLIFDWFVGWK